MEAGQKVKAWLERELGGMVVAFERQQRWRPAWFADVSRDGSLHRYYVRGSRTSPRRRRRSKSSC